MTCLKNDAMIETFKTHEDEFWEFGYRTEDGRRCTDWMRLKKSMAKPPVIPYVPRTPDTKHSWQTKIRKQRRVFFETLPVSERSKFLCHIWKSRTVGDYQGFRQLRKVFPTFFVDG